MKTRKVRLRSGGRTSQLPISLSSDPPRSPRVFVTITCLLLVLAILVVYAQTLGHGFVFYDDDQYVYENLAVQSGISVKSVAWAFTTFYFANWHPLTWISYQMVNQLFGLNAGAEHALNVILHLGATLLLFLALARMTHQPWRCALVAGIFALHPLHVESVAWVSERKDVLSTFFQILTLWLYVRYSERPSIKTYSWVAVVFALSVLAKPMAVTFPFVLLLLDLWPLRRIELTSWRSNLNRLLLEKAPLIAMSVVASVLTFLAQRDFGAVRSLTQVPFSSRLANAAIAYLSYIGKAFWPEDLAVLYPLHPPSTLVAFASVVVLAAVTVAAVVTFRGRPYFLIGWLWYLGMLVPVIGLVQVGAQSMADRYTYLPLVGLSIALIWTVGESVKSHAFARQAAVVVSILALVAMTATAYQQAGYWKDSTTLFRHALSVTTDNSIVRNNLAAVLQKEGRRDEAAVMYRQSLASAPDDIGPLNNLGAILAADGKVDEAIALHRRVVGAHPDHADAQANLGRELMRLGQFDEALAHLNEALRLKPDLVEAHSGLAILLASRGSFEEAKRHMEASLHLSPADAEGQNTLCYVERRLGHPDQAMAACNMALKIKPDLLEARFNLGAILASKGLTTEAAAEFSRVLAVNPNHAPTRAAMAELQTRSQ